MVEEVNLLKFQSMQDECAFRANLKERLHDLAADLWPSDNPRVSDPEALDSVSLVPTQWLSSWFDHPEKSPPMLYPSSHTNSDSVTKHPSQEDVGDLDQNKFLSAPSNFDQSPSKPLASYHFPVCSHKRIPIGLDPQVFRAVSTHSLRRLLKESSAVWENFE